MFQLHACALDAHLHPCQEGNSFPCGTYSHLLTSLRHLFPDQVIGTVYRARYYFAWALGEASLCFAGLDFLGWQDPDQQQQHSKKQDSATESESEGAAGQCITNGKQKLVALWGRCNNAKPLKVEFCDAGRLLGHVWNISTGMFLRR